MRQLIEAGMDVARLNSRTASSPRTAGRRRLRAASAATGRRVAIMADLPGPKMRIGNIAPEPVELGRATASSSRRRTMVGTGGGCR